MIEEIIPLSPLHFFALEVPIYPSGKKGEALPPLATYFFDAPSFAKVALSWSEKGIVCQIAFDLAFEHSRWPHFREGDSVELFFDTRDQKSATLTRFCHHFVLLPTPFELQENETLQSIEMTKFRGEERHELAPVNAVVVEREKKKMEIFLSKEILHGYDPSQFQRLGFAYRINRLHGEPQFFSAPGEQIEIASHPSYWATLHLTR